MITGYVDAHRAFGEEAFLTKAITNAEFLLKHAIAKDGEMTRNYKKAHPDDAVGRGKSSIKALLDDYAFTISAFINLYQATFNEKWLKEANTLTAYAIEHFFDPKSKMFFYTHNQHSNLISRKMEVADNVIPSSNSEMAKNLFLLGHFFYNEEYIGMAKQMLINVAEDVQKNIYFYANWGILQAWFTSPLNEIAITGDKFKTMRREFDQHYLPDVIFLGGNTESKLALLENKLIPGQTTIYVCRNKTCKMPVTEVAKALQQIKKF